MDFDIQNEISISQYQGLRLNTSQLQSLSMLCMNSTELKKYLYNLYEINPCIDIVEHPVQDNTYITDNFFPSSKSYIHTSDDAVSQVKSADKTSEYVESLDFDLRIQLKSLDIRDDERTVCNYLLDHLNENGWLEDIFFEELLKTRVPKKLVYRSLDIIQGLEPAGVGARNLNEFLILQLKRKYPEEILAKDIIEHDLLNAIARHQYQAIAKVLNADITDVTQAVNIITSLKSGITDGTGEAEENINIIPDIYIYADEQGKVFVETNKSNIPKICIHDSYKELYKTTDDNAVKEYLKIKIAESRSVINSLERRDNTLEQCFTYIANVHADFFSNRSEFLQPLTLEEVAQSLKVNTSTISRCIKNKYIQCRRGIYKANYFFPIALNSDNDLPLSSQSAKEEIRKAVKEEDLNKPLRDSDILKILQSKGYSVTRRVVTKYRSQLGIPEYRIRRR